MTYSETVHDLCEMDRKKKWLEHEYCMMYSIACRDAEESRKQKKMIRTLYFDTRYWTTKDILIFFEDLCFADHEVWAMVVKKLSHHAKARVAAEKRYKKWLDNL